MSTYDDAVIRLKELYENRDDLGCCRIKLSNCNLLGAIGFNKLKDDIAFMEKEQWIVLHPCSEEFLTHFSFTDSGMNIAAEALAKAAKRATGTAKQQAE